MGPITYASLPIDVKAASSITIDETVPTGLVKDLATGRIQTAKNFVRAVRKRERQNRKQGRAHRA